MQGSSQNILISPKQAAKALGVSESSLKRWCDNGKINVTRTPGGHRKMSVADLFDFVRKNDVTLVSPELLGLPPVVGKKADDITRLRNELTDSLLSGDELKAQGLVFDLLLNKLPLHKLFDDIITPAIYEIGRRWECNEAEIYQERMGCQISLRLLHQIRRLIPLPNEQTTAEKNIAIGGTLSGDRYTIATAMVELILRNRGIHATSIGASIPGVSFVNAIRKMQPKLVWISTTYIENHHQFLSEFRIISKFCIDRGILLVIGGNVFVPELRKQISFNFFGDTMKHLDTFAKSLGSHS